MKTSNLVGSLKNALLIAVFAGVVSQTAQAQSTYLVTINTSALASTPLAANGPFSLDLQLNYGSGPFTNSAVAGNFSLGGGTPTASPVYTGTAAGDLTTAVTMSDNSTHAFNEFTQQFAPGAFLSFDVTLSANQTIDVPDSFHVAILDTTPGGQIPTTQPTGSNDPQNGIDGLDLAEFDINGQGHIVANTYGGANNASLGGDYSGVTVTVQAVPEPSSWALAALAGSVFVIALRRHRNRA